MNTIMVNLRKLRVRARSSGGFSLGETLVALLLVSLLTMGIATGVAFGARQYRESMILSESRILCSTLTSAIRSELSTTEKVWNNARVGRTAYASTNYVKKGDTSPSDSDAERRRAFYVATAISQTGSFTVSSDSDAYGQIVVATATLGQECDDPLPLVNSAAYSSYKLQANIDMKYNMANKVFEVTIKVKAPNDTDPRVTESFAVIQLNDVLLNPDPITST